MTATVIALPIGLYDRATRVAGANLAINVANIGRAIPSYAMMVIILPISLPRLDPDLGLNLIPTFIAMVLLAIPPILVNTYAGLREVDRDLVEAGPRDGHARTPDPVRDWRCRSRSPVIVGRIPDRDAPGHRDGDDRGGRRRRRARSVHRRRLATTRGSRPQLFGGVILVAGLAIGVDLLFALIQRRLTPPALRGDMSDRREDIAVPTAAAGAA